MADKMSKLILPVKSGNTIVNKEFDIGSSENTFVGTTAEWEALTTEQQNTYDCRILTDDDLDTKNVIDNLISDSSNDALSAKQGKVLKELTDTTQSQVSNSDDAYSSTRPYEVGELCIHNDVLYRCTTPCSAGSWATNQSCFTVDTLVNVANGLNGKLVQYPFLETSNNNITNPDQYQILCELNCSQGTGLYLVLAVMNYTNTPPKSMRIDVYSSNNILQYSGINVFDSSIGRMSIVCPVYNSTYKIRLSGNWAANAAGCSAELSIVKILGY